MPGNWTIKYVCIVFNNGEAVIREKVDRMAFLQDRRQKLAGLYLLALEFDHREHYRIKLKSSDFLASDRVWRECAGGRGRPTSGFRPSVSDRWPSFPRRPFLLHKRKARLSLTSNLAEMLCRLWGLENTWAPNRRKIEIMVLLLMKINDCHDSITNTFTIQVTSNPLFSKVERGLIELSVDH